MIVPYRIGSGGGLESYARGTLSATGGEDVVVSYTGALKLTGWVDMTAMVEGDAVNVRVQTKLSSGGAWVDYTDEMYMGAQDAPAKFVLPRGAAYGVRVVLDQVDAAGGIFKDFPYDFYTEP